MLLEKDKVLELKELLADIDEDLEQHYNPRSTYETTDWRDQIQPLVGKKIQVKKGKKEKRLSFHLTEELLESIMRIILSDNSEPKMALLAITTSIANMLSCELKEEKLWKCLDASYTIIYHLDKLDVVKVNWRGFRTIEVNKSMKTTALEPTNQPFDWINSSNGGYGTFQINAYKRDGIRSTMSYHAMNKLQRVGLKWKELPKEHDITPLEINKEFPLNENQTYHNIYQFDGCRYYAVGHQFNPMGDGFRKASCLNLANSEPLDDNGLKWVKIAIASLYSDNDKLTFDDRLKWFDENERTLEKKRLIKDSDKAMYFKLVEEYREYRNGKKEWNSMVGLDATTSGLQILSILGKDLKGAMHSNIVGEGRSDFYTSLNNRITKVSGKPYDRNQTKRAIMTHFYWSVKTPQRVFKADYQLFRSTIKNMVPSVDYAMNRLIEVSKIARKEVTQKVEFPFGRLEYDTRVLKEIDFYHSKLDIRIHHYMYKTEVDKNYKGLVARIVHYIDGWIVSQMVNRNKFDIGAIHDCFYCHPNNVDKMRSTYNGIMKDLYDMDLLESICSQFGVNIDPNQLGTLEKKHISCEYAIC